MSSNYYRKAIRKLLITYILIFIILTILVTLVFVGLYANQSFRKKNIQANQEISSVLTSELEVYMDFINSFTTNHRVFSFLTIQRSPESVYELLYDFNNERGIRSVFYVVDKSGNTVVTNNHSSSPYSGIDLFFSGIFKDMKSSGDIAFSNNKVQIDLYRRTIFSLGKRIEHNGETIGYVVFDILEQDVMHVIENSSVDIFVLIDSYYNSIITNNSSILNEIGKLSIIKYDKEYVTFRDIKYFYSKNELLPSKLSIVVFSPVGLVKELMITSFLFMFLTLLIMIVVVIKLSDIVTRRRTELINQELHNRTKLATIKQLEAQFNPHFIFNTLETLKYLLQFNQEKSMDLIIHFAKILRYSIYHEEKSIGLSDDLDYIQSYLMIQKYRYGTRLTYTVAYDESLKNLIVPKLILQPIIENCIVHGYTHKENLHIDITITRSRKNLTMVVTDNGDGIPDERLKEVKGLLKKEYNTESSSIGLYNVQKRIQLLYGKGYGVSLRSKVSKGTSVIVVLPVITKGKHKSGESV